MSRPHTQPRNRLVDSSKLLRIVEGIEADETIPKPYRDDVSAKIREAVRLILSAPNNGVKKAV